MWWYFWRIVDAGSMSARTGQRPNARETFLLYSELGGIGNVLEVCAPVNGVNLRCTVQGIEVDGPTDEMTPKGLMSSYANWSASLDPTTYANFSRRLFSAHH